MVVRFPTGAKIFLFSKTPRPVLVPIQLLVDWILGTLSPRAKRQGLNLSTHLNSVPKLSMSRGLCIHSLLRFCSVWRYNFSFTFTRVLYSDAVGNSNALDYYCCCLMTAEVQEWYRVNGSAILFYVEGG